MQERSRIFPGLQMHQRLLGSNHVAKPKRVYWGGGALTFRCEQYIYCLNSRKRLFLAKYWEMYELRTVT